MLESTDFLLSPEQIDQLNTVASSQAKAYGKAGAQDSQSLSVIFEFTPWGREIYLKFGSKIIEIEIYNG